LKVSASVTALNFFYISKSVFFTDASAASLASFSTRSASKTIASSISSSFYFKAFLKYFPGTFLYKE